MKLHGTSKSRSARSLWAAEEVGAKYEHVPTEVAKAKSPEHLKLNPNGHIPALEDNGHVVWESMAINLYLAQKYDGPLHCASADVLGLAAQWSFWAMLEIEPLLLHLLEHRALLAEFARDASAIERNELLLKRPLGVLNDALAGRDYLAGTSFTVADLNVASILIWAKMARLDMSAYPDLTRWLNACLARPAYARIRAQARGK